MKRIILTGLLISIALAIFLSPFASKSPDGLERVAEDKNFLHMAEGTKIFNALIPDYVFPGIKHEGLATAFSGLLGTLITFGLVYGLGRILKRKSK